MVGRIKILEIINIVKSRRQEDYIVDKLSEVELYVMLQTEYNHQNIMEFIDSLKSGKLGGRAIYINNALDFLQSEIRLESKRLNKLPKYTSIFQETIRGNPVFGVINYKERDRSNNDLTDSDVIIDGKEYKILGVESFLTPTIFVGDKIGLMVEEKINSNK